MALSPRLDLRQSQTLVMTPQLQQAIKLLQLSNTELAEYVEQELEQNPLLQRDAGSADAVSAYGEASAADLNGVQGEGLGIDGVAPDEAHAAPRDSAEQTEAGVLPAAQDAPLDMDEGQDWSSDRGQGDGPLIDAVGEPPAELTGMSLGQIGSGGRASFEADDRSFEDRLSQDLSLRDHLLSQLNVEMTEPSDRIIGATLIDLLDDSGYLSVELEPIAESLGCSHAQIEAVLTRLQDFEPSGVFARNLAECLAIQLRDRDRLDPAMQALLDNLELLAGGDATALCRACEVDEEDLAEMVAEIRALDPKPASSFETDVTHAIVPDILMRPSPDGGWNVELNTETLPRVLVDHRYYALVHGQARKKDERQYISEQYHSANWLIKSLHQRATTILKVASEIVRQQDAFFRKGIQHLKPLVLRDIADAIAMHESTVSRVTSNKYIATPRGLFELKYFFTASIGSTGSGEAHSAAAVRHRIKEFINAEDASAVLSDDQIVDKLRAEGIDIARRTVAKYREAMKIPSSVQRRRQKKSRL